MSSPAKGFSNIQKKMLEDLFSMQMVLGALDLDATELNEAFTSYNKVVSKVKQQVLKACERIETVETAIHDLKIKVKDNA